MSWAITGDWLGVAALVLATFGTGAQAWANLAQYKILRRSIPDAASDAVGDALTSVTVDAMMPALMLVFHSGSACGRGHLPSWAVGPAFYLKYIFLIIFFFPRNLMEIRTRGGDDAVQLAQFLRLAMVWGILMAGSVLALAAAAIQLALAWG